MAKDYLRNKFNSEELADRIRDYYHKRGHLGVRVWVEEEKAMSTYGTRLPSNFSIRSNIKFYVDKIPKGMLE